MTGKAMHTPAGVFLFSYIKKGTIIKKTYGGVKEISSYMNIFSVKFSLFL